MTEYFFMLNDGFWPVRALHTRNMLRVAARVPGLMLGTEGSGRSDRSLEIVARNLGNWKLRGIARLVCDNSESPQDAVGRTAERLPRRTPPSAALRSSSARPRSTSRKLPTRQIRHLDLRPNVRCSGACSYPMRLLGFRVACLCVTGSTL